ncbi:MAG: hypothetical protein KAQ67_09770, partial [Gammaproteobacteria bacterium]|nr:hypothetical protein [Gammaproteobacteria bacterium]
MKKKILPQMNANKRKFKVKIFCRSGAERACPTKCFGYENLKSKHFATEMQRCREKYASCRV